MASAKLPVVYDYLDFRAYLRAYYGAKKAADRGFSFRVFSRLAGVKASNHLKLVMDGKRGLPARPRRVATPGLSGSRATRWSISATWCASIRPPRPASEAPSTGG
ncbi:MAG: TIGR02147 family protein [Myxococcales bacterium]|jgi:uncharacterized protein (TIGR02147 family)